MTGKCAGHRDLIHSSHRRVRSVNTELEQLVVVIEEDVGGSGRREGWLNRVVTLVPKLEGVQAGRLAEGREDVGLLRIVDHILGVADSPTYCNRDITARVSCQIQFGLGDYVINQSRSTHRKT
jgi:hypothetical protein